MADETKKPTPADKTVEVPLSALTAMQKQMADLEIKVAEQEAKNAGLEELFSKADTSGEPKLREKKNYEPKFRTARLRSYPVAGNIEDKDYIVGITNRGAYQEVDRSGIAPTMVDYVEVIFLRNQKSKDGKIKAEKIKLLDLMNAPQVVCKVLKMEREEKKAKTGEEINVTVFDPQHGLIATGDIIDGYVGYSEITVTLQVPNVVEPVIVDQKYVNL